MAFAGTDASADSPSSARRLLLTASNDKTVVLWDVNKAANGMPKAVTRTDRLHASGIFSLDVVGTHILTAGKDARSVYSELRADSGEISVVRSFEAHRSTVTKCARFRPALCGFAPTVFADCGNDMCVCVLDLRSSSATPSIVIEGDASHGAVINSVAWHPTNEHILASVRIAETAIVKLMSTLSLSGTELWMHFCFRHRSPLSLLVRLHRSRSAVLMRAQAAICFCTPLDQTMRVRARVCVCVHAAQYWSMMCAGRTRSSIA